MGQAMELPEDTLSRVELHRTMVESITATEVRRQNVSGLGLSVLAAGVAVLGLVPTVDPLAIFAALFIVAGYWLASVLEFRRIAQAKWAVVREMEKALPLRPFTDEWTIIKSKRRFLGLSHLEASIPTVLGILSIAGFILVLVRRFTGTP